jgi:hypothetical protein
MNYEVQKDETRGTGINGEEERKIIDKQRNKELSA